MDTTKRANRLFIAEGLSTAENIYVIP